MDKFYAKNLFSLSEDYIEKLRIWRNQSFVRNNMFNSNIITRAEHSDYIEKIRKTLNPSIYIFFYQEIPIGVINFFSKDESTMEFGYYLIREEYINKGFGAIMEYMILDFLFNEKDVFIVFARTLISNFRVISLHKRFGFDTIKKGIENNKEFVLQTISKEKWLQLKEMIEKSVPVKSIRRIEN